MILPCYTYALVISLVMAFLKVDGGGGSAGQYYTKYLHLR